MPTTYTQTVEVWLPGEPDAPIRYDTSLAPVAPPDTTAIEQADGTRIFWTPRYTYSIHPSTICFTWYTKPTLAAAVTNLATNKSYYEFNKDGTVCHKFIDFYNRQPVILHWSAAIDAPVAVGTDISTTEGFGPYYESHDSRLPMDNTYVEVSCRNCGADCEGSDYYKEGFCSRWCIRDHYRD